MICWDISKCCSRLPCCPLFQKPCLQMSNLALLDWFAVLLIKACVCYFLSNYFFFHKMIAPPGLIQKEKVHIICEKGAQISILANKIVTQWWPNFIIKESNQTIHWFFFYFLIIMFTLHCWFNQKTGMAFNDSFSFTWD